MIGEKISSGLPPIDEHWGGFYRGGVYVLYGRLSSGRGLAAMHFARAGVEGGERVLVATNERVGNLNIQSAEAGLDLVTARNEGRLMLVSPTASMRGGRSDGSGAAELEAIETAVREFRPGRLVLNHLPSFQTARGEDDAANSEKWAHSALCMGGDAVSGITEDTNNGATGCSRSK